VKDGVVQRLRARAEQVRERHEWVDHLARASQRYFRERGNHFAAAMTFFTILTAVPLLMVAFAAASYVLWFNPGLLADLEHNIAATVPAGLSESLNPIIETAIDQRNSVATIGLLGALYSGVWWMSNLREAVSAQWALPAPHPAALKRLFFDLRELIGLGAALAASLALTVLGSDLTETVLRTLGAPDDERTRILLRVLGVILGITANWLIFAWAITRLPAQMCASKPSPARRCLVLSASKRSSRAWRSTSTPSPAPRAGRCSVRCSACCFSPISWHAWSCS
jgi:membrane protein